MASGADAIVTLNLRYFRANSCASFAIEPMHPGALLLDLYNIEPNVIYSAIERRYRSSPDSP